MSDVPSIRVRIAIMTLSSVLTAAVCEGLIRVIDGNATPMIRLFESDNAGHIRLKPNGKARIARAVGDPWEIHTNADGHRAATKPVQPESWIVVGDSQVMGNGVNDADAFPALLTLDGMGVRNLGVPGYGVADALWSATQHLDGHPAAGVIVLVNQMNDWDEVNAPVGERYRARGGWLIDADDADGPRGQFLGSPLSRSHLIFLLGHLALKDRNAAQPSPPKWMTAPVEMRHSTMLIANAIQTFADAHPTTNVVPVYLPADIYATRDRAESSPLSVFAPDLPTAPWDDDRLRDQVMVALAELKPIDLTDALSSGEHFLDGDYHLSERGHAAVASTITTAVEAARAPAATPAPTAGTTPPD